MTTKYPRQHEAFQELFRRLPAEIKQRDLARSVDLSEATVSLWVNGRRIPSGPQRDKIARFFAKFFDVDPKQLATEFHWPEPHTQAPTVEILDPDTTITFGERLLSCGEPRLASDMLGPWAGRIVAHIRSHGSRPVSVQLLQRLSMIGLQAVQACKPERGVAAPSKPFLDLLETLSIDSGDPQLLMAQGDNAYCNGSFDDGLEDSLFTAKQGSISWDLRVRATRTAAGCLCAQVLRRDDRIAAARRQSDRIDEIQRLFDKLNPYQHDTHDDSSLLARFYWHDGQARLDVVKFLIGKGFGAEVLESLRNGRVVLDRLRERHPEYSVGILGINYADIPAYLYTPLWALEMEAKLDFVRAWQAGVDVSHHFGPSEVFALFRTAESAGDQRRQAVIEKFAAELCPESIASAAVTTAWRPVEPLAGLARSASPRPPSASE